MTVRQHLHWRSRGRWAQVSDHRLRVSLLASHQSLFIPIQGTTLAGGRSSEGRKVVSFGVYVPQRINKVRTQIQRTYAVMHVPKWQLDNESALQSGLAFADDEQSESLEMKS